MGPLARILVGSVAGAGATFALSGLRKALAGLGIVGRTAPEQVVDRMDEVGMISGLSDGGRRLLTLAAHLAYGLAIGGSFGALRRGTGGGGTEAAVGTALGVLSWAVNWAGVLPLAGVHRPPWRQHDPKTVLPVLDHAFYGAVWGLLYGALRGRL